MIESMHNNIHHNQPSFCRKWLPSKKKCALTLTALSSITGGLYTAITKKAPIGFSLTLASLGIAGLSILAYFRDRPIPDTYYANPTQLPSNPKIHVGGFTNDVTAGGWMRNSQQALDEAIANQESPETIAQLQQALDQVKEIASEV